MDSVYTITHHATFLVNKCVHIQRKTKLNMSQICSPPSWINCFLLQVWQRDDIHGGIPVFFTIHFWDTVIYTRIRSYHGKWLLTLIAFNLCINDYPSHRRHLIKLWQRTCKFSSSFFCSDLSSHGRRLIKLWQTMRKFSFETTSLFCSDLSRNEWWKAPEYLHVRHHVATPVTGSNWFKMTDCKFGSSLTWFFSGYEHICWPRR